MVETYVAESTRPGGPIIKITKEQAEKLRDSTEWKIRELTSTTTKAVTAWKAAETWKPQPTWHAIETYSTGGGGGGGTATSSEVAEPTSSIQAVIPPEGVDKGEVPKIEPAPSPDVVESYEKTAEATKRAERIMRFWEQQARQDPRFYEKYKKAYAQYRSLYIRARELYPEARRAWVERETARISESVFKEFPIVQGGKLESAVSTLFEFEKEQIRANIRHILYSHKTVEARQQALEKYLKQWEHVGTERIKFAEWQAGVAPAHEAYYRSTGDPFGAGIVKFFEGAGKGLAELVSGKKIEVREPNIDLTSGGKLLMTAGEVTGFGISIGGIAGSARAIASPVRGLAKGVLGGAKQISIKPVGSLAARIGGRAAMRWTSATARAGAFAAKYGPGLGAAVGYGAWAGLETKKLQTMVSGGAGMGEVLTEFAKDITILKAVEHGFTKGLEEGAPVAGARVRAGGRTIWKGLRIGPKPVIGRAGGRWVFGTPRGTYAQYRQSILAGYQPGAAAETRFQAELESRIFLGSKQSREMFEAARALQFTRGLMGTKVKPKEFEKILKSPFERAGFPKSKIERFMNLAGKYKKRFWVFGSGSKAAQFAPEYKIPKEFAKVGDIDIYFTKDMEKFAKDVKKIFGRGVRIEATEPGTLKIKSASGQRLLDIHTFESAYGQGRFPWGLNLTMKKLIKYKGFKLTPLGKEAATAWNPMKYMQVKTPSGRVVEMIWTHRPKDLFRYLKGTYTLSTAKYGAVRGMKEFEPIERWIKGKLRLMGFTEAEISAGIKRAPTLIYSPPSSVASKVTLRFAMPSYYPPSRPSKVSVSYPSLSKLSAMSASSVSRLSKMVSSTSYRPSRMPSLYPSRRPSYRPAPSISYRPISYRASLPSYKPPSYKPYKLPKPPKAPKLSFPFFGFKPKTTRARGEKKYRYGLRLHPIGDIVAVLVGKKSRKTRRRRSKRKK